MKFLYFLLTFFMKHLKKVLILGGIILVVTTYWIYYKKQQEDEEPKDPQDKQKKKKRTKSFSQDEPQWKSKPKKKIHTQRQGLKDDEKYSTPRKGLVNLGNTCYMNSGIQAVLNIRQLTNYFKEDQYLNHINEENFMGTGGKLAIQYGNFVKKMYEESSQPFEPIQLKAVLGQANYKFEAFDQQDSFELFSTLIDSLSEDLSRVKKRQVYTVDLSKKTDSELSSEYQRKSKMLSTSIMDDLLNGQTKSVITCLSCQNKFKNRQQYYDGQLKVFDKFNVIPLPIMMDHYIWSCTIANQKGNKIIISAIINTKIHLEDLLEVIEKQCQIKIEKIFVIERDQKRKQLQKLKRNPEFYVRNLIDTNKQILCKSSFERQVECERVTIPKEKIFHLLNEKLSLSHCILDFCRSEKLEGQNQWFCKHCKRDQPSVKKMQLYKLNKYVVFLFKRFDYLGKKIQIEIDFPQEIDLSPYSAHTKEEEKIYDLRSVINHSGSSLHSGHYTANCKDNLTDLWYNFNDESIRTVDEKEVVSSRAYLLVYKRKN